MLEFLTGYINNLEKYIVKGREWYVLRSSIYQLHYAAVTAVTVKRMAVLDTPEEKRLAEQLYEKYHRLVYYIAYHVLNNHEDAEDVAIESWEKIFCNLDKITQSVSMETKSFITIITERTAIDFYRKNKRKYQVEKTIEEWESSPYFATKDRELEEAETLLWLRNMPKIHAEILILYYVNGFSTTEITKILGIKESAVNVRMHRARKYLEEEMKKNAGMGEKKNTRNLNF